MRWTERREKFRAILAGDRCIHPASVFDPISARIAEDLGFEAGMFAGSIASMTVLGAPDLILLTLTEFAEQVQRISRAGNLPLMVDADHGYGNALNVMRTVEELETAGVSGLSIEDTELPQVYGAGSEPGLLSIDEGVGKMKAALEARRDPNLVIVGRTSLTATDTEDAMARITAYEAAGVDAIFLVAPGSREQLEALAGAVKLPLIIGAAAKEVIDLDYLSATSVRVCLQGHQPFAAAVRAIHDTLKALREGTAPADLQGIAPADLMKRVRRDGDYERWTDAFLGGAEASKRL